MDVEMKVSGMSYDHGEQTIKHAVHLLQGVHHIEVQVEHGIVKIDYDQDEISLQTICDVIEVQGYIIEN